MDLIIGREYFYHELEETVTFCGHTDTGEIWLRDEFGYNHMIYDTEIYLLRPVERDVLDEFRYR